MAGCWFWRDGSAFKRLSRHQFFVCFYCCKAIFYQPFLCYFLVVAFYNERQILRAIVTCFNDAADEKTCWVYIFGEIILFQFKEAFRYNNALMFLLKGELNRMIFWTLLLCYLFYIMVNVFQFSWIISAIRRSLFIFKFWCIEISSFDKFAESSYNQSKYSRFFGRYF